MYKEFFISDFLKRIKRPINLDDNQEYKLVTIKMNHNGVVLREKKRGALIKSNMYLVKEGDFILSGIDARNGAFGIVPKELDNAIVTNDFWYFEIDESIISKQLFLELTSTTWFDEICKRGSDGTTQRIRLQKDKFFSQKIQLPLREYQDELLEKTLFYKEKQFKLSNCFEYQYQNLKKLKTAIIGDALKGLLTTEWRKENINIENADKLLQRIRSEKEINKNKSLKNKNLINPDNFKDKFELPNSWKWCSINDISNLSTGDSINKEVKNSKYKNLKKGYDYIGTKDVDFGGKGISYNNGVKIPFDELKFNIAPKGSVLICIEGGSSGKKIGITDRDVCYGNKLLAASFHESINPYFYFYLFQSLFFENEFKSKSKGLRSGLALNEFKTIRVPLPPVLEQNEIIKRINSLFVECEKIELEIKNSQEYGNKLMKAVLKDIFEVKSKPKTLDCLFEDINYNLYVAMIHKQIENRLRINYGEVATQKTVFNINAFTDQKIPYNFINSNHGTFSPQLKDDLSKNSYLAKDKKGNGEVFIINPSKQKEVLDALSNPKNKSFVRAVNEVLDIYELPFINKETDKIELLNTVAKLIIDTKSTDLEIIYEGMQKWEIKQNGFNTKAEKFSKPLTKKMIALIENLGLTKKLLFY